VIEIPTTTFEPCADTCCETNRPQIFFPSTDSESCCKNVSKLVVPIDLSILDVAFTAALDEISNQVDPVQMLVKLMRLIESSRN
jgi:hypothetical protein